MRQLGKRLMNDYFAEQVADSCDWLGLQYYFHCRINHGKIFANDFKRRSDLGWELYPQGIEPLLMDMNRYGKPIYVTESGLADAADKYRAWYIEETLRFIARAIARGVDCHGYFHFSLTNGKEWDKGRSPDTGLIHVDFQTQERSVRPSALRYAGIIADRGL
jgi:beta-glucosidase/6-phospho-beta-glucosidase/beta-galactosidase